MGRKVTTGRTGRILHCYAPIAIAERVETLITTRAITESHVLTKALEIALPQLEEVLPMADEATLAEFRAARSRRQYKHRKLK